MTIIIIIAKIVVPMNEWKYLWDNPIIIGSWWSKKRNKNGSARSGMMLAIKNVGKSKKLNKTKEIINAGPKCNGVNGIELT